MPQEPNKQGPLARGISPELQEEVLAFLLFDNEMYDSTKDVISEDFFYDDDYKLLYRTLKQFHKQNKTNPTVKDMMINLALVINNSTELMRIKQILLGLNNNYLDEYIDKEPDVKKTHFEQFIRRSGFESFLGEIIYKVKNDIPFEWDPVIDNFNHYSNFTISQSKAFNMGNITQLMNFREQAIGTNDFSRKIPFFLEDINMCMNHRAAVPGTLTMVSAAPGTGKTMFLVNQGKHACINGFTSLHVFIGDLNTYAASLRYLACFAQKSLSEIIAMTPEQQMELMQQINNFGPLKGALSNNVIMELVAGQMNVQQVCNEIKKTQLKLGIKFNQIIIDYDANIKPNLDNMYDSAGEIYNYLREFAIANNSVMLVASQPKISFFSEELLTLDAAGESSQKQHIIDLMITLGKPGKLEVPIRTLFVPKNRDGKTNKKIHLLSDGAKQTFIPITQEDYENRKREAASAL